MCITIMAVNEYLGMLQSDLHRYTGRKGFRGFWKQFFFISGFRYTVYLRSAVYFRHSNFLFRPFHYLFRFFLRRCQVRYGISIPYNTSIGPGFYIGHYGGIVINSEAVIGKNCNINHGVTIGETYGGKYPGVPVIGDHVYLGPGCTIIGSISLGDNVAVGANSVVTKPVPDNSVVVGCHSRITSHKGSSDYIVNTV